MWLFLFFFNVRHLNAVHFLSDAKTTVHPFSDYTRWVQVNGCPTEYCVIIGSVAVRQTQIIGPPTSVLPRDLYEWNFKGFHTFYYIMFNIGVSEYSKRFRHQRIEVWNFYYIFICIFFSIANTLFRIFT